MSNDGSTVRNYSQATPAPSSPPTPPSKVLKYAPLQPSHSSEPTPYPTSRVISHQALASPVLTHHLDAKPAPVLVDNPLPAPQSVPPSPATSEHTVKAYPQTLNPDSTDYGEDPWRPARRSFGYPSHTSLSDLGSSTSSTSSNGRLRESTDGDRPPSLAFSVGSQRTSFDSCPSPTLSVSSDHEPISPFTVHTAVKATRSLSGPTRVIALREGTREEYISSEEATEEYREEESSCFFPPFPVYKPLHPLRYPDERRKSSSGHSVDSYAEPGSPSTRPPSIAASGSSTAAAARLSAVGTGATLGPYSVEPLADIVSPIDLPPIVHPTSLLLRPCLTWLPAVLRSHTPLRLPTIVSGSSGKIAGEESGPGAFQKAIAHRPCVTCKR